MLREDWEELKIKDFIIKDLLQTIKEITTKSISLQSIPSCMSSSKGNVLPANNSIAIKDVYNNNGKTDTDNEIFIPDKKISMILIYSKKFMQNQLEEVIKKKKKKFHEFEICGDKNSDATNNNGETQGNTQTAQQSL